MAEVVQHIVERRRTHRVDVMGNAVVHGAKAVGRGRLVNLSTGGACLELVDDALVDVLRIGLGLELELHVDAARGRWYLQRGVVRHIDRRRRRIGVAFLAVTPQVEDLVEDEILAEFEAADTVRVVVLDGVTSRRERVSAALRRAGCIVIDVETPLDALAAIEQSRAHISIVAVAEGLTQTDGAEVMAYLSDVHPGVQLAVITARADDVHVPMPVLLVAAAPGDDQLDADIQALIRALHGLHARRAVDASEPAAG